MSNPSTSPEDELSPNDIEQLYSMALNQEDILASASNSMLHLLQSQSDRYGEKEFAGQGGMKKIYRVLDKLTDRHVAMAELVHENDPREQECFLREARLTAALEHPNIMPIYDLGSNQNNLPFFTMKYTGDRNLYRLLKDPKSTSFTEGSLFERLNIFIGICEGMAYAHSRHILHLDLKPRNILVGEFGEVLISDWGLGKVMFEPESEQEECTQHIDPVFFHEVSHRGAIKGTPGYMAPEQIDKSIAPRDQRTDIFSMGGILFSLLCGTAPFEGRTPSEIFEQTLSGSANWNQLKRNKAPKALQAVIHKALAPSPENRYPTVNALKQEIVSFMGGYATAAENAGFIRNMILLTKRYKPASILSGALLMLVMAFTAHLYRSEQEARRLLSLYTSAQQAHIEYRESSIEELFGSARQAFKGQIFRKAMIYLNQIISAEPTNQKAWALIGECHFFSQKFSAAADALEKGGEESDKLLTQQAIKYAKVKSDEEQLEHEPFMKLIKKLPYPQKRSLFSKIHLEYKKLPEYIEIVEHVLIAANKLPHSFKIDHQKLPDNTLRIDLSGATELRRLYPLKHLPVSELILQDSAVAQNQTPNLTHLPLRKLNIAGTRIRRFEFIENLPSLQELTIYAGRYSEHKLSPLRNHMKIIELPSKETPAP